MISNLEVLSSNLSGYTKRNNLFVKVKNFLYFCRMKDIRDFCKLFSINIPVEKHFNYYVKTLIQAGDISLEKKLKVYEAFERTVLSAYDEKMRWFGKLTTIIESTQAYTILKDLDIQSYNSFSQVPEYGQFNHIAEYANDKHEFISFDIVSANFQTLKLFDKENELGASWEDFLFKHEVPEVFKLSKSFRQYIFGNLNPKRYAKIQSHIMNKLHHYFITNNMEVPPLVMKSNDELIYALPNFNEINKNRPDYLDYFDFSCMFDTDLLNIYYKSRYNEEINFKCTNYTLKSIGKQKYLKTEFVNREEKKSLLGVEGNQFYMYLKKYIIDDHLNNIDKMFTNDGKVAMWLDTEI